MGVGEQIIRQPAGYSGTSLGKKLGIKSDFIIQLVNAPGYYLSLFGDLPANLTFNESPDNKKDMIHFFTKETQEYFTKLPLLMDTMKANGMIWVSWPKKASKVKTDITENIIRNFALKIGLVDVKVCAVDDTWSALKLVIPVKNRGV
jgi:hypothetical protein